MRKYAKYYVSVFGFYRAEERSRDPVTIGGSLYVDENGKIVFKAGKSAASFLNTPILLKHAIALTLACAYHLHEEVLFASTVENEKRCPTQNILRKTEGFSLSIADFNSYLGLFSTEERDKILNARVRKEEDYVVLTDDEEEHYLSLAEQLLKSKAPTKRGDATIYQFSGEDFDQFPNTYVGVWALVHARYPIEKWESYSADYGQRTLEMKYRDKSSVDKKFGPGAGFYSCCGNAPNPNRQFRTLPLG